MLSASQRKVPPDRYQEIKYSHCLGPTSIWIRTCLRRQWEKTQYRTQPCEASGRYSFIYLSICSSPCPYAVCLNSSNKRQGPCIKELLVQWETVWFLFMFCYRCAQRCYGNTTKGHLFLPRGVLRRLPEVEFRNFHRRWERMREKMVRNSKIWGIWIFYNWGSRGVEHSLGTE